MTYAEGKSGNPIVLLGKASEKEAPWPGRTSGVVTCCSLMTRAERSIGRENDRNGYSPIPFNASKGVRLALTLFLNIFIPLAFTRKLFVFFSFLSLCFVSHRWFMRTRLHSPRSPGYIFSPSSSSSRSACRRDCVYMLDERLWKKGAHPITNRLLPMHNRSLIPIYPNDDLRKCK